ncbi:MAG: hypothetical protein LBI06_07210 [Treponema sp.]|jgi:hypothetical protein|nr:hypothetical protein [Treponema sp.]
MNKKTLIWRIFAFLVAVAALCVAGCDDKLEGATHADPELLIGEWTHEVRGTSFTIRGDQSFECELFVENDKAKVSGRLDGTVSGLGPNDYILRSMTTTGDSADYPANISIGSQVSGFSNTLVATLTISADRSRFIFTSNSPAADAFFGGEYTRVE